MLSRNAASSRAIPVKKLIEQIEADPFIPERFGSAQPGMQAGEPITGAEERRARAYWAHARMSALHNATRLAQLGVHKQLVNRLLEPFSWTTVVVSATDWDNFFHLRTAPDAQPEFRHIASMMLKDINSSKPVKLKALTWHLPFITDDERKALAPMSAAHISAARCARVSYLTHEGKRDTAKDIELADRLVTNGHMSPFEHPAMCQDDSNRWGNFTGFMQLRKLMPYEADPKGTRDVAHPKRPTVSNKSRNDSHSSTRQSTTDRRKA